MASLIVVHQAAQARLEARALRAQSTALRRAARANLATALGGPAKLLPERRPGGG